MAINQRSIKNFAYETLAAIKAVTAVRDGENSYCYETDTVYKYLAAGSAYTANDRDVLTTGNAGNTRWIAISGKYNAVKIEDCVIVSATNAKYATIASAIAAGEKNIFVKDGVYVEDLTLSTNGVTIVGESILGTILRPTAADKDCFRLYANYCRLENLTLDTMTGDAQAALVIGAGETVGSPDYTIGCNNVIHNCYIKGPNHVFALYICGASYSQYAQTWTAFANSQLQSGNVITNCIFDSGYNLDSYVIALQKNCICVNNEFRHGRMAYYMNRSSYFCINNFVDSLSQGIYATGTTCECVISNNTIINPVGTAIRLDCLTEHDPLDADTASKNNVISNNIILNAGYSGIDVVGDTANPLKDNIISGNIIKGAQNHGISLQYVEDCDISGNIIINPGTDTTPGNRGAGIYLIIGVKDNHIHSNKIIDKRASNYSKGGIVDREVVGNTGNIIDSNDINCANSQYSMWFISDKNTIKNNKVSGGYYAGIYMSGVTQMVVTNNIFRNNTNFQNNTMYEIWLNDTTNSFISNNICISDATNKANTDIYEGGTCTGNKFRGNMQVGASNTKVNTDEVTSSSSSVTNNAIVRMDDTTGKIIQTSLSTIDDAGAINIPAGQTYNIGGTPLAKANITGLTDSDNPTFSGLITNKTAVNVDYTMVSNTMAATHSSAAAKTYIGVMNDLSNYAQTANNTGGLYGMINNIKVNNASAASCTNTTMYGIQNTVGIQDCGASYILDDVYGQSNYLFHTKGEIYNFYGLHIDSNLGAGTVYNKYGIYVNDANMKNYFAGYVGIGTVTLATSQVGGLNIKQGTNPTALVADQISIFATSGANCTLGLYTEAAISDNKLPILVNGTSTNMLLGDQAVTSTSNPTFVSITSSDISVIKSISNATYTGITVGPSLITHDGAAAKDYTMLKVDARAYTQTANNTGYLSGINIDLYSNALTSGTLSALYGINNGHGIGAGTGTITNLYGYYSMLIRDTGTITNYYALYLDENDEAGTVTNMWGIYAIDSTMKHFISGNLLIGSATASYNSGLEVSKTGLDASSYGSSVTLTTSLSSDITSETFINSNWINTSYIATTKTDSGKWVGTYNAMTANSTNFQGTLASMIGSLNAVGSYSTGVGATFTNIYGTKSEMYHRDADSHIVNSYMFHGSIAYNSPAATVDNFWGIYLSGCTKNYLAGSLLLSDAALETSQVGGLNIKQGTNPTTNTIEQISIFATAGAASTIGIATEAVTSSESLAILHNTSTRYLPFGVTNTFARYYHMPISSLNPGNSGATHVAPSANSLGGWQIDGDAKVLYFDSDVHSDWNGSSDLKVEVLFEKNTAGGTAGDTVDLLLTSYYKGATESVTKSQTQTVPTVVADNAQYTTYKAEFTIDWDAASNVVEAGDYMKFKLNIVNATSECDDIIINSVSMYYSKSHPLMELSDV